MTLHLIRYKTLIMTATFAVLASCSKTDNSNVSQAESAAANKAEVAATPNAATAAAIDINDPALIQKGKQLFVLCQACHAIDTNSGMKVGPHLANIVGRPAVSAKDYAYSAAFQEKAIVWDNATLDQWLANPAVMIPGNKMAFGGVANETSRAAIIAYLSTL